MSIIPLRGWRIPMTYYEEAQVIAKLVSWWGEQGLTEQCAIMTIAARLDCSKRGVRERLATARLPAPVLAEIQAGRLSATAARRQAS